MSFIRWQNSKDNAPKLSSILYNVKLNLMSQSFKFILVHLHHNSAHRIHQALRVYAFSHHHHIFKLESFEN